MSRLAEILETGQAPGFNTKAIDPQLPEKAVPRAFKNLEQTHSADKIARDARFSVKQIKRIWNMLALLTGLLALPAVAADLTRSVTFSDGQRLTAANLHTLVDGATISTAFLTGKDLLSASDSSDYMLVYDTSAGVFKRMTLGTLVLGNTELITAQVEKPNLVPLDYLLIYDSVGTIFGKISYTNLLSGNTNLIGQQPVLTGLSADAALLVRHGGTNAQIAVSNLWTAFLYRAAFTNLAEVTAPTNTDRLLIWDSAAGTNKYTTFATLSNAIAPATGIAKAWAKFSGTATGSNAVTRGFNIAGATRDSLGDWTVHFSTAASSTNYVVQATVSDSAARDMAINVLTQTTTNFTVKATDIDSGNNDDDPKWIFVTVYE